MTVTDIVFGTRDGEAKKRENELLNLHAAIADLNRMAV
jgi:hypothetical protein